MALANVGIINEQGRVSMHVAKGRGIGERKDMGRITRSTIIVMKYLSHSRWQDFSVIVVIKYYIICRLIDMK